MTSSGFKDFYSGKLKRFEDYLRTSFPRLPEPVKVLETAMQYSLFAGGKRIRPILLLTTVECTGKESDFALPFAAALEYIHTYSLIHDDLPCMDDDDLRRGKPTNHIAFGEAIALLAGDALLTHAFALISSNDATGSLPPENVLKIVNLLAEKAGIYGMVTGQVSDIQVPFYEDPAQSLDFTHRHKTGALITLSIQMGAILAGVNSTDYESLTGFGAEIGKCFQIQDDILDETGDREKLGKSPGSDQKNQTLTYPKAFGLEKSEKLANQSYENALRHLDRTNLDTTMLRELANFVLKRDR